VGIVNAHIVVRVCAGTVYVRDICLQLIQAGGDGLVRSQELNGEPGAVAIAARHQSLGAGVRPRIGGPVSEVVMMKGVGLRLVLDKTGTRDDVVHVVGASGGRARIRG
jgi:hypothetical protein